MERRTHQPILQFRVTLSDLIRDRFGGHYTVLAQRAGIPISSLEHTMLTAKRLPGGDHLIRLAVACGTTVDHLLGLPGRAARRR